MRDPFLMVVMIIAIVTFGRIMKARYRAGDSARTDPQQTAEAARLREEVTGLKQRVAVLERLITDERGSRELDREIEALRSRGG